MNKSESIVNLAVALSKAQAELPIIKFDSVNPFLKNKFASLGAIVEGARPVLAKYGLAVSQLVYSEGNPSLQITVNKGSKGELIDSTEVSESTIAGVETILLHSSGEWISSQFSMPVGDEKGKSSAQVAGSIITYIRRYSYAAILGIIADEDGDGAKPALSPREKRAVERERAEQSDPVTDLLVEKFATDKDPMTIERAMKIENSEGVKYGDIPNDKLQAMVLGINKGLRNGIDDEKRAEYLEKKAAIGVILKARANKEI